MKKIKVITDSCAYLHKAEIEEHEIEIVPLQIIFKNEQFLETDDINTKDVFNKVDSGDYPTTSQPTPQAFLDVFEKVLIDCDAVLYLGISSEVSGTIQSAKLAKQMYEGNKEIYIHDTFVGGPAQEIFVLQTAQMLKNGASIVEVISELKRMEKEYELLVTVDDLKHLVKSGRLKIHQAILGNILRLKPILNLCDGKLGFYDKVRTKKKAMQFIIDKIKADVDETKKMIVRISYVTSSDVAYYLKEEIEQISSNIDVKISREIGPVFAVHFGRGGFAVAWVKN